MGLDWCLERAKPKPGSERRFAELNLLFSKMEDQEPGGELAELEEELKSITISCYEAAGAPRVGIDDRATEWFREKNYVPAHADALAGQIPNPKAAEFWKQSFEECLKEVKGQYVMELADQEGGIASVSGMVMVTNIDFRGKVLRFCDGLDEELVNESYQDHTGEECLAYAKRLEEDLPNVGEEHKELVQGAINWLRFWGERGFGYHAWY